MHQVRQSLYGLDKELVAEAGQGELSIRIDSGSAVIYGIASNIKDNTVREPVTLEASSAAEGHEAAFAFDGKNKTSWKAAVGEKESALTFDFGKMYYLDRFSLRQKGETTIPYQLQIESDSQWKTIYESDHIEEKKVIFLQGKEPVKTQKVRFVFGAEEAEISEVSLVPYDNWTLEGNNTIAAEKKDGTAYELEPEVAKAITDGDRITNALQAGMGSSTDKSRHVVTLEMDEKHPVNAVRVITSQAEECASAGSGIIPDLDMTSEKAQYSYRVSYRDGSTWKEIGTTVKPGSGYSKVFNEFVLKEAVETDAIQIEIYTSHWVRLVECEVAQSHKFSPFVGK